MDVAYCIMRNAVFADALAMRHNLPDDTKGDTERQMDPVVFCCSHACRNNSMHIDSYRGALTRVGSMVIHASMLPCYFAKYIIK